MPMSGVSSKKKVIVITVVAMTVFTIFVTSKNFYGYSSDISCLSQATSSLHEDTDGRKNTIPNLRDEESTDWEIFTSKRDREDYDLNQFKSMLEYNKEVYDILNMKQVQFDPAYKNPCWVGTEANGPIADGKFHCMPHFYIIGVKKSGTTDLFGKLSRHPEFIKPGFKESQWLPRRRWGITSRFKPEKKVIGLYKGVCRDIRSMRCYISLFDNVAQRIFYDTSLVTAEATPANLHIHTNWPLLPGNEGLTEPKYTNFHYLNHMTPKVKIVIIFRDPVTRLYSDFWHTMTFRESRLKTPDEFHDQVSRLTKTYSECFSRWSIRRCIYNETIRNNLIRDRVYLADSFTAGFYAFYMTEMISVFGKDRIFPIFANDYYEDGAGTFSKLFHFLGMSQLSPLKMKQVAEMGVVNKKTYAAMLNESLNMLYSFYEPFNRQMVDLMKDDRYLFKKT